MTDEDRSIFAIGEEALSNVVEQISGRSGNGGGGLEARIAKLEAAVEHIQSDVSDIKTGLRQIRGDMRSDFRWTLAAFGAGFAALLGILGAGFNWW